MPAPLLWDTQGLTWGSDVTWDGEQSTKPKRKSMNTKAIINFEDYTAAELSPVARAIHTAMTTNAATFGTLPVTLTALDTFINTYDTTLAAKADRSKSATVAFNAAREDLEEALGKLGNHVNTVAGGDPVIVTQSGFPSYVTTRTPDENPPAPPQDLRLKHGPNTGSISLRCKPDRSPSMNEVQINLEDPADESKWQSRGHFKGGTADIDDLPPGTIVWVRVRTLGSKNTASDWSDLAQIRVL